MIFMKNFNLEDKKMKKSRVLIIVSVLLLLCSANLSAQGMHLFLNGGIITDDSLSFDPFLWSVGANLDFTLGGVLMLSPEANIITYKFKFDTFLFQPAILLNIKLSSFFVGGGIQKLFLITGDGYESGEWGLKLNAGLMGKNIKLRVFADMAFDNLFKDMLVGAQIGIGF
jgi:hypothetical protein